MKLWTDTLAVFPRHWIWDIEPVYHLRKEDIDRNGSRCAIKTRCGLELWAWDRETGQEFVDRQVILRREHADKFAKACGNCVRCSP